MPGLNDTPLWTPDGQHNVFESRSHPNPGMYWIRADGSGEAQRLTNGENSQFPASFSPNGKLLAYSQTSASGNAEIWTSQVEGDADHPHLGKAERFVTSSGLQPGWRDRGAFTAPVFSPDGHWLAYQANETGTVEIFVQAFPGPGGKWQISTGGGRLPIWSRDAEGGAREIYFLAPDQRIMTVAYTATGDSFVPGKARVWSEKRLTRLNVGLCVVKIQLGGDHNVNSTLSERDP